jgi:hypothetical protein
MISRLAPNWFPLTVDEFKSWLSTKRKRDVVGRTREASSCPIARVLKEKESNTEKSINVYPGTTYIQGTAYENPDWVKSFIEKVDTGDEYSKKRNITTKEALQIVNNFSYCTVCNQYNPEGTNCGKKDNCPW